ncbi:MAG: peptidylprolyl isomerase [Gemmatimonadaceae bacterium]|jgi:peptidyl-prolyl cis-trans isomerase SurA|nr:peptidylprolyl isomerase [Gemmatimonadaceae bacterium]
MTSALRFARLPLALALFATSLSAQPSTAGRLRCDPQAAGGRTIAVDRVVAVVGDQVILCSDLLVELNRERAENRQPLPSDPDSLLALEKDVLARLVDAEVLIQKATADKVEVDDLDVNRQVDDFVKRVRKNFRTDREMADALAQSGYGSVEEWRKEQVRGFRRNQLQQGLIEKLRKDGKMPAINVSEDEVNEAYARSKGVLPKRPASIGWRQIVVRPNPSDSALGVARAKIDSLYAEIDKTKDFESVAKRESQDPGSKELGGDLGWNRRGQMVPEFDYVMFNLRPGLVSAPVLTRYGLHLIRVDRVQPAEVKARHILIMPVIDSVQVAKARDRADSVLTAWKGGANFDTLASRFSDEPTHFRSMPETVRDSLLPEYKTAFEGKKEGDFVGPFPLGNTGIGTEWAIAQLTLVREGGDVELKDIKDRIRDQLAQEKSMRRVTDTIKKGTFVSVRLDEPRAAPTP